jgi:hypothetical protein
VRSHVSIVFGSRPATPLKTADVRRLLNLSGADLAVVADATKVVVGGYTTDNRGDAHVDRIAAFVRRSQPA